MKHLNDEALVSLVKQGDKGAFCLLFRRYKIKARKLAMRITRNEQDADDSLQSAFMKAFTHINSFREDARFSSWFYRIVYNEAAMVMRKRKSVNTGKDKLKNMVSSYTEERLTPEKLYAAMELEERLSCIVSDFKEEYQNVLRLVAQGKSMKYVAEQENITKEQVKMYLFRARRKLERVAGL